MRCDHGVPIDGWCDDCLRDLERAEYRQSGLVAVVLGVAAVAVIGLAVLLAIAWWGD